MLYSLSNVPALTPLVHVGVLADLEVLVQHEAKDFKIPKS